MNFEKAFKNLLERRGETKKQLLPGGEKHDPKDFDADALAAGTIHELEHTDDEKIAEEIAMDHLAEDPKYYEKIKNIAKTIRHENGKFVLYSKDGSKKLGTFDSEKAAMEREKQINYFKNVNKMQPTSYDVHVTSTKWNAFKNKLKKAVDLAADLLPPLNNTDVELAKRAFGFDECEDEDCDEMVAKMALEEVTKGGPGSGGAETEEIDMECSPHISVGTRKGVLENMAYFDDTIPVDKITHVGQKKYVPAKLEKMLSKYDDVKDKPIDVLKVGDSYHVIDGHHRYLAHKEKGAKVIKARVRVRAENAHVQKMVSIMKANDEKQIVYGVVLAPDEADLQNDVMEADDIEEAAHLYLKEARVIGSQHTKPIDAYPVESYIAPADIEVKDGRYGDQKITKGSWVLGVKIVDPKEWEKVKNGEYTGFSVGGVGAREKI